MIEDSEAHSLKASMIIFAPFCFSLYFSLYYLLLRPVPLQHYVFPAKAEGLFLVVDEKGKFR